MKKINKALSALTLMALIGLSNPVVAQPRDNVTPYIQTSSSDSGKWGLAGLLGLLGLLGLRKRNNDNHRTTTNR